MRNHSLCSHLANFLLWACLLHNLYPGQTVYFHQPIQSSNLAPKFGADAPNFAAPVLRQPPSFAGWEKLD
jgi:hypothetical protein